jgi:hypothetical protein
MVDWHFTEKYRSYYNDKIHFRYDDEYYEHAEKQIFQNWQLYCDLVDVLKNSNDETEIIKTIYTIQQSENIMHDDSEYVPILKHVNNNMKNNENVVMSMLSVHCAEFYEMSNELQNDRDFIEKLLKENYKNMNYISREMACDREIAQIIAIHYPYSMEIDGDRIECDLLILRHGNRDINNTTGKYPDENTYNKHYDRIYRMQYNYHDDFEATRNVVMNNPYAISFVCNNDIINNKEIMTYVIKHNNKLMRYAKQLKNDKTFIMGALNNKINIYEYITKEKKHNRDICNMFVSVFPQFFNQLSPDYQNNKYFVLNHIKKNCELIEYVSNDFKNDYDVVNVAYMQNKKLIKFASTEMQTLFGPKINKKKKKKDDLDKLLNEGLKH